MYETLLMWLGFYKEYHFIFPDYNFFRIQYKLYVKSQNCFVDGKVLIFIDSLMSFERFIQLLTALIIIPTLPFSCYGQGRPLKGLLNLLTTNVPII